MVFFAILNQTIKEMVHFRYRCETLHNTLLLLLSCVNLKRTKAGKLLGLSCPNVAQLQRVACLEDKQTSTGRQSSPKTTASDGRRTFGLSDAWGSDAFSWVVVGHCREGRGRNEVTGCWCNAQQRKTAPPPRPAGHIWINGHFLRASLALNGRIWRPKVPQDGDAVSVSRESPRRRKQKVPAEEKRKAGRVSPLRLVTPHPPHPSLTVYRRPSVPRGRASPLGYWHRVRRRGQRLLRG